MKRKKKAKRASKISKGKRAKVAVFKRKKRTTVSGLKKGNVTRKKSGKVVSTKRSGQNDGRNLPKNGNIIMKDGISPADYSCVGVSPSL